MHASGADGSDVDERRLCGAEVEEPSPVRRSVDVDPAGHGERRRAVRERVGREVDLRAVRAGVGPRAPGKIDGRAKAPGGRPARPSGQRSLDGVVGGVGGRRAGAFVESPVRVVVLRPREVGDLGRREYAVVDAELIDGRVEVRIGKSRFSEPRGGRQRLHLGGRDDRTVVHFGRRKAVDVHLVVRPRGGHGDVLPHLRRELCPRLDHGLLGAPVDRRTAVHVPFDAADSAGGKKGPVIAGSQGPVAEVEDARERSDGGHLDPYADRHVGDGGEHARGNEDVLRSGEDRRVPGPAAGRPERRRPRLRLVLERPVVARPGRVGDDGAAAVVEGVVENEPVREFAPVATCVSCVGRARARVSRVARGHAGLAAVRVAAAPAFGGRPRLGHRAIEAAAVRASGVVARGASLHRRVDGVPSPVRVVTGTSGQNDEKTEAQRDSSIEHGHWKSSIAGHPIGRPSNERLDSLSNRGFSN